MFDFLHKRRKATLVLGGGSARGVAHIGVLKVLDRENIPIERVVGTSMGALIGAAYATGIPIRDMENKALNFTSKRLMDPTIPRMGMLAGNKLEMTIRDLIDGKTFKDARIPMAVVATDIETGEEVVYQQGELTKVVRASCSWPGIFNPVNLGGRLLCDGGIKNSVPTRIAKSLGADFIIAVDVGFCIKRGRIENIFQMILQSFQITGEELNKYQAKEADVVIKVDLGDIDQSAFERSREAMEIGRLAAESKIEEIKKGMGL